MTLVAWLTLVIVSAALVGGYRKLAVTRGWFDVPNQRSSHKEIVPRGAGVVHAILILLVAMTLPWSFGEGEHIAASFVSGCAVALAGWWDDVRGLTVRRRFLIYLAACISAVSIIFLSEAKSPGGLVSIVLVICSSFALLWVVNLYNFMDGINGIAAAEGVFISIAALWLGHRNFGPGVTVLLAVVAATLLGFLPWNFPRARVFMGDVGSAFLGFCFGVLALWSIMLDAINFWQWLILGGVFVVDASYTLLVRMVTGQKWREAHRLHGYQILSRKLGGHGYSVAVLMVVNVGWLLPWAYLAQSHNLACWLAVAAAYLPLLLGCYLARAGLEKPLV